MKSIFKNIILFTALLLILLFGLTDKLYSQFDEIKFDRISIESGLSQSSILCICKDRVGFFWFGTYDGLNRFDGYQFKVYKNDPANPFSLSNNHVETIIEDKSGDLWFGTENGLEKFDREKERFIIYRNIPNDTSSLSYNYIRYLYEDPSGNIWVGTYGGGLNKFDKKSGKFIRYLNDPQNNKSLSNNRILAIFEDSRKQLWVGTNIGLNRLDKNKREFTRYMNDPKNPFSVSADAISLIFEDKKKNIWIGTWGEGLDRYDYSTNRFYCYKNEAGNPHSLSHNIVRSILQDKKGNIWVGTDGGGINILKNGLIDKNQFIRLRNDLKDPGSISSNSVLSIYEDKSNIIWLGTDFGGINKCVLDKKKVTLYRNQPDNPNSLNNNSVVAIMEDENGIIWIGTNGGGVNRFDRKNNKFAFYLNDPKNPSSITHNIIRAICEDSLGKLWIGTDGGLNLFDPIENKFTWYRNEPNNKNSLSDNTVWSTIKDKAGDIWVGTTEGLNRFDYKKQKFIQYKNQPGNLNSLSDNYVWSIFEDSKGIIWIGTLNGGLNRFDPKQNTFTNYKNGHFNLLSNNKILCLREDHNGIMWIGCNGGLFSYDRNSDKLTSYSGEEGLPHVAIQGILEDGHGNMWLSTTNGLLKINPKTLKYKNYFERDGFQGNEYIVNACCKLKSGEMIFGGNNGFNIFYPDSIKDNSEIPKVVFTDFQINYQPVPIGEKEGKGTFLNKSITESDEITLSYKDNVISLEFAALHYIAPMANQYAYMMEGFDNNWNYTKANRRFVTYTNLPGGTYIFHVKASNNDGIWNEKGTSIKIIILPPWWKTLWFRILFILTIITCSISFYLFRVMALQRQKRALEQKVDERTSQLKEVNEALNETNTVLEERQQFIEEQAEEIKTNNENLKDINELLVDKQKVILEQSEQMKEANQQLSLLNATKDKFFSIIAHDLRNPFNAVSGFSNLLIKKIDTITQEKSLKYLNTIYTASKTGNNLLENLLQWSRSQTGHITFEPVRLDLFTIAEEVLKLIEGDAEQKNISIKQLIDQNIFVFADENMLKTVFRNIVSNAIKFSYENGTIILKSGINNQFVEVNISDSGVGISKENIEKLFRIDVTVSTKGTLNESGTGLGLVLCKEFIEKNGGKIWVESEVAKGSSFIFTIPKD